MSPRNEAIKRATAIVLWAAELTDEDIQEKDAIHLSNLFGLRYNARKALTLLEKGQVIAS